MPADTAEIDTLYRLPLNEFTPARNALAAKLTSAGRAGVAARVKALPKPPLSAWVVNQLYWRHRPAFTELMAAGERARRLQVSQLRAATGKGADLRKALEARRAALADLARRAAAMLADAGHAPSPDVSRRITTTLDALATYGRQPNVPQPGRLTADIDAPGLKALTSLVRGRTGSGDARRVIPFQKQRQQTRHARAIDAAAEGRQRIAARRAARAAAEAAVRAAERALADARRIAARAEAALKQAAARARAADQKKEALAARLEKVAATADRARQGARRIAAGAEEAAQAVADAERALEEARRARKAPSG